MKKTIFTNSYFATSVLSLVLLLTSCNSSLNNETKVLAKNQTTSLTTLSFSKVRIKNNHLLFDLSLSKTSPISINFYILLENTQGEAIALANSKTSCEELQYRDSFLNCSKHPQVYQWTFSSGKFTTSIKLPLQQEYLKENFVLKVLTFNNFITKHNRKNTLLGKNTLFKTASLVSTPDKLNLLENYSNLSVPLTLNVERSFSIKYKVQKITAETLYLLNTKNSIATENQDFIKDQGSLIINSDQPVRAINISVLDDEIYEGPQSFMLILISNQAIFEGHTTKNIVVTIDDDEEAPYLQISDFTSMEKREVQHWPVSLSWSSEVPLSFEYKLHSTWINDAESATDYLQRAGRVEFAPNVIKNFIPINIIPDDISEGTENFSLSVKQPPVLQLNIDEGEEEGLYTAFIADSSNQVVPSAQFSTQRLNTHPGRNLNIAVEIKGPITHHVKVYYRSFSQSALASKDFEDKAGFLYFPASTRQSQRQIINIQILNKTLINSNKARKSFYLYIEKVQNGKINTNRKVNIHIL